MPNITFTVPTKDGEMHPCNVRPAQTTITTAKRETTRPQLGFHDFRLVRATDGCRGATINYPECADWHQNKILKANLQQIPKYLSLLWSSLHLGWSSPVSNLMDWTSQNVRNKVFRSDGTESGYSVPPFFFLFNTLLPRTVPEVREWQIIPKYRRAKPGEDDRRA